MSANIDEDKESQKSLPLDLARNQITTVRTIDGSKAPLVMTSHSLRNMRVLTQGISPNTTQNLAGSTIITTNIVSGAVLKDSGRPQIANIISSNTQNPSGGTSITLQRPQITLSTTPMPPTGTTYHVPRGAAVVANIAAPRANTTGVRPMLLTAQSTSVQSHSFTRPSRTPSPAQGTAWLNTNTSNGSQIKGAPTVLSSPVRGATVTGKPQLINRTQGTSTPNVQTIRPATGTAILHSAAIAINTPQNFKTGQSATLNNTVTIAQVIPQRTQAIVYNPSSTNQFITASRITVASTVQNQRTPLIRPTYVTSARVLPTTNQISANKIINPQGNVLSSARISTISTHPTQTPSGVSSRILTTQPTTLTINRLAVSNNNTCSNIGQVTTGNNLSQARILHSLVAVGNSQTRNVQSANVVSGAKVITQSTPGTIHLTPLSTTIKTTQVPGVGNVPNAPRTINVPAALVTRPTSGGVVSTQTIPIVKACPSENNSQNSNVFIHAPVSSNVQSATSSPNNNVSHTNSTLVPHTTTTVAYTLPSGTYFYDATGSYTVSRNFQQTNSYTTTTTTTTQPLRPLNMGTQVQTVNQQSMRYNSVMMVSDQRNQFAASQPQNEFIQEPTQNKVNSSPRPSILRKRDHEGSPLKAAKNLNTIVVTQRPQSPLSPRPDSHDNGNSSGGSTTISATSSPGFAEEDSLPPSVSENHKEEEEVKPPIEMSPRKKPRKQQLTGNDIDEHNDDIQFICDNAIKKEDDSDGGHSDEPKDGAPEAHQVATVRKPATASLLNSYRQTWKATHNHYLRYSDVRPKDEKKATIIDLANQYRVQDKVNGWKVHHISTQMEDLADQEATIYSNLSELLKCMEKEEEIRSDKDINRINELIKGNLQRIKIINDGMNEAKTQVMRVFDHKSQIAEIINRCASKRNFKKREKS